MRRSIRWLLFGSAVLCAIAVTVLATILVAPGGASAQAGLESITSYDTRIAIQRDGSILVTEQIAYDFGSDERHGIFREIPVRSGTTAHTTGSTGSMCSQFSRRMPLASPPSIAMAPRPGSRSVTRTRPSPASTRT